MKKRKITLAAARVNAGMKQKDVAKIVGVTPITLGNWEKGVTCPGISTAQQLADLYGLTTDDIFFAKMI